MKPMLAFRYQDNKQHLRYPLFLQPKLNGVRALNFGSIHTSRDEKQWSPAILEHIRVDNFLGNAAQRFIFDGELYKHGKSLQQINSAIAVKRVSVTEVTKEIEYHVFDIIDITNLAMPFSERLTLAQNVFLRIPSTAPVKLVPTHVVHNESELMAIHSEYIEDGYEGTMIRTDASYGFAELCGNQDNRWKCLLKHKEHFDDIFDVLGFEWGEGKYEGKVGSLKFEFEGRPFTAGSGLLDSQRDPDNLPTRCHLKWFMLSDNGTPLQPVIECAHYD
jgi:DNA ligase-1